jgi:uncharacterized protein
MRTTEGKTSDYAYPIGQTLHASLVTDFAVWPLGWALFGGGVMPKLRRFDWVGKIRIVTDAHTPAEVASMRRDGLVAFRTQEGFLRVEGRIMRSEALPYSDGVTQWNEYRSRAEIEKSLESFKMAVVTLGHPEDMVHLDNVESVQVGHLGSALRWDDELKDHIRADFLITHKAGLDAVADGTHELSVGFLANVIPVSGIDANGVPYSFEQIDIEGNHVAIVPEGRAGHDAKLLLDGAAILVADANTPQQRKDTMEEEEIKIGDQTFMVPKAVAEALRAQSTADANPDEEEVDDEKDAAIGDELTKLRARCDRQDAELANLKAERDAKHRSDLLADALRIGVKVDAKACKTDADIMRAVVLAKLPSLESRLDAHANEPGYLKALYDDVLDAAGKETPNRITQSVHQAVADAAQGDGDFFDRLDAWTVEKSA